MHATGGQWVIGRLRLLQIVIDDGESACKRDSVIARIGDRWPSISAVYPKAARPCGRSGRAAHTFCSTLLRVGFAEPPGSPRTLVRSYRTVSPLPVPVARPSAVCSLLHWAVRSPRPGSRQHPARWSPDFPRHGRCRAAATRPTHRRRSRLPPEPVFPGRRSWRRRVGIRATTPDTCRPQIVERTGLRRAGQVGVDVRVVGGGLERRRVAQAEVVLGADDDVDRRELAEPAGDRVAGVNPSAFAVSSSPSRTGDDEARRSSPPAMMAMAADAAGGLGPERDDGRPRAPAS